MPPRLRLFYSIFGLALLFTAALPLYREFSQRSDIWWTPAAMAVPLAESKDRVMIVARGKPLLDLVQAGALQVQENGATSTLAMSDIGLRFNNWDRVRATRLPLMLTYAFACGVSALLILLTLTGRLAYRADRERTGAEPPVAS
jgi:hypothetical protein